ncbi:unnamed protein product [Pylaiella littoralis]
MMAGQGLAGLAVALAGLFTTAGTFTNHHPAGQAVPRALDDTLLWSSCATYTRDWSTLVYFGVAVVVLLGCLLTYPLLERLPLTAFFTCGGDENGPGVERVPDENFVVDNSVDDGWLGVAPSAMVTSSSPTGSSMYRRLVDAPPLRLLSLGTPLSDSATYDKGDEGDNPKTDGSVTVNAPTTMSVGGIRARLSPISRYAFAVFMAFTITLSVFPGATSKIVSSRQCKPGRSRFFAGDVFVMFSFLSFNAFDLMGRLAAGLTITLPRAWLPTASVSRLVFVPLLLACRSENSRFRNSLTADVFPLTLLPLLAVTNGYISSLSMMAGSQKGAWAGTAMVLFLCGGLLAGSLLSFVVLYASTES